MAIKILKKSFAEHRTIDSISTKIMYQMTWLDYYNGYGDLVSGADETDIIDANFSLPYEGDSYGLFFNTNYLSKLVLTDITMEPTTARVATTAIDLTLQDLDKEVKVTYTWSNEGGSDTKRVNEASSWKLRYNTILDDVSVNTYIDTNGDKIVWAEKYLDDTDPNITIDLPSGYNGAYSGGSDNDKKEYRDAIASDIPEIIKKTPRITVTLTAYGSEIKAFTYAKNIGKVNSDNFLGRVYSKKEEALIEKNKLPSYDANEWLNVDDTGHWLFIDWNMEDVGNGFFEFELTFEFEDLQRPTPDGEWNRFFDSEVLGFITLDMYKEIDFFDILLSGMDKVLPNDRDSK